VSPDHGLDDLRDERGAFRVLAVDHRDSLRVFLSPDDPDGVPSETLTSIKADLVRAISPFATGVMLEPEYSIPQVLPVLAPGVGFLAALEAQGYLADPGAAPTSLLPGWSVEQAAASGAAAAKLLLPYHPDAPLAAAQEAVALEVLTECRLIGLPLVLEPLFHSLADPADRERVVRVTVERFAAIGPDLLKLPFPVDPTLTTDHDARAAACAAITARCEQPWAILSGGGGFDEFVEQVAASLEGGCAGFMVGRALWGEAATCPADRRSTVIDQIVLPRWHRLTAVVDRAFPTRSDRDDSRNDHRNETQNDHRNETQNDPQEVSP
jgi:tagatose-1,6-bisphosphate aldolase